MDVRKLLEQKDRDEVWAEARENIDVLEKVLFRKHCSDEEIGLSAWLSLQVVATEIHVYEKEIENIGDELKDEYTSKIINGTLDIPKFLNKQDPIMAEMIAKLNRERASSKENQKRLEDIRNHINNVRLILLYYIYQHRDMIFQLYLSFTDSDVEYDDTELDGEEQRILAKCQTVTHALLVLKDAEIDSLDGSWFEQKEKD